MPRAWVPKQPPDAFSGRAGNLSATLSGLCSPFFFVILGTRVVWELRAAAEATRHLSPARRWHGRRFNSVPSPVPDASMPDPISVKGGGS
jgi:hypothetical protein